MKTPSSASISASPGKKPTPGRRKRAEGITRPLVKAAFRYAEDVLAGKIPAGELVRLACLRHQRDWETRGAKGLYFDQEAADFALNFFPDVLRHTKGVFAREPIHLGAWQLFRLASVMGWKWRETGARRFRQAYNAVPRKNGKSTEAAGLGIIGMVADGEEGAEIYSYATKRDQAKIVWGQARSMVLRSPYLRRHIRIGARRLSFERRDSFFDPLSSDVKKLDGLNPHMAICDELHAHKSREAYDVIASAFGARLQSLHWLITTRGSDQAGICGELDEYTTNLLRSVSPSELVMPAENRITNDAFFGIIYTIDAEDDWQDPAAWRKANPNYGVSVDAGGLADEARMAATMPSFQNEFRRKKLNLWTETTERWIEPELWEKNLVPIKFEYLAGRGSWWGLDLSATRDLTALAGIFELPGGYYALRCWFWMPEIGVEEREKRDRAPYAAWRDAGWIRTTPGPTVRRAAIARDLAAILSRDEIEAVGYDRWRIDELVEELDGIGFPFRKARLDDEGRIVKEGGGVPLVNFGQGYRDMAPAVDHLELLIAEGKLLHDGNPVLRMCVANAKVVRDEAGNRKFTKKIGHRRIDGLVAATMAAGVNKRHPLGSSRFVYQDRGFRTL